jgi:hypothetical protein
MQTRHHNAFPAKVNLQPPVIIVVVAIVIAIAVILERGVGRRG